jgi:hypothetical protein
MHRYQLGPRRSWRNQLLQPQMHNRCVPSWRVLHIYGHNYAPSFAESVMRITKSPFGTTLLPRQISNTPLVFPPRASHRLGREPNRPAARARDRCYSAQRYTIATFSPST